MTMTEGGGKDRIGSSRQLQDAVEREPGTDNTHSPLAQSAWEDHHVGVIRTIGAPLSLSSSMAEGNGELSLRDLLDRCDNYDPYSPTEILVPFRISPESTSPVALGLIRPQVLEQIEKDISSESSPSSCPFRISIIPSSYLHFTPELDSPALRTAAVASYLRKWHENGVFDDVIGGRLWRDELYDVYANPFGPRRISQRPPDAYTTSDAPTADLPRTKGVVDADVGDRNYLFSMERAACALFGVVTYGVHMIAYEQDGYGLGAPTTDSIRMWIPRRSATKQTLVSTCLTWVRLELKYQSTYPDIPYT